MMPALRFPAALADRLRAGDERVVVTGASGWLGQALLEMLQVALGSAASFRVHCFGSAPKLLRLRDGTGFEQRALVDLQTLPCRPSMLFHFACLTKEKTAAMSTAEYVERNRAISTFTEHAAAKIGADRMFFTSSGAAAQALAAGAGVDSGHAYGALKLEDEMRFRVHAERAVQRRVFAVRLYNLSGPYINKIGSYALSSFIDQARRSGVIEIRSARRVIRSYTGVENLLATAMGQLLGAQSAPWACVDTAGEQDVEVGELAERVHASIGLPVAIHRPAFDAGPDDRYVGDGTAYRALASQLGIALHRLDRQIEDTSDYLIQTT